MPKLPVLTPKELIKVLKKFGFELDHTTGSHRIFRNPKTGKRAVIPFHLKSLPKGTFLSILREAGLKKDDISG
ncbi:MAG: type II toxin-antitoxin system HicA family toxin [Candidatus Berkelbacteria bacterium]|nr:type II toxin-antitoxin system HicA family toxin [Candidatus Berkelbacteria bacterium]